MSDEVEALRKLATAMTPDDSPLTLDDVEQSALYRDLRTPTLAPGDPAVDFAVTGAGVRLSDHFGKRPVALIFGSYS